MHDDAGSNRRAFLAGATTVLAAAAMTESAAGQKLAPHPLAAPTAHTTWDLSWVDRVSHAKHKAVFDSPEIAGGTALVNAFFYLRDYKDVYNADDADMGVVIVVRHFALPIVFGDASWAQFQLGTMAKIKDPVTGQDATSNPFARVRPGDKTILYDTGAAVDTLIGRGVTVLCCNEALKHFAEMVGKTANMSAEDARRALIATMIPGVRLVPSGIFGLARAGEAGCHYIRSS